MQKTEMAEFHRKLMRDNLAVLFGEFDDTQYQEIEPQLEWLEIHAGEILFHQGDEGDSLFFVISGRLQAFIKADAGEKVIGEIFRGETAGEMAMLTGDKRSASVRAIRDTVLVKLTKSLFEFVIARYPDVALVVTRLIIERQKKQQQHRIPQHKPTNICLLPMHASALPWINNLVSTWKEDENIGVIDTRRVNTALNGEYANTSLADVDQNRVVTAWLDKEEALLSSLFYIADATASEWTKRCIRQADLVVFVGDAEQSNQLGELENELLKNNALQGTEQHLLLVHPSSTLLPSGTIHWLNKRPAITRNFHVRSGNEKDLQRMSRVFTGKANGLVLAGGGAKGFAHVGVYKALLEKNVPVDFIGGTSMGAMMAAAIAFQSDYKTLHKEMKRVAMYNPTKDFNWLPMLSFIKGKRLRFIINSVISELSGNQQVDICDLWIPCFAVSSNYTQAREEVHYRGELSKVLRATAAIPGVFPPVVHGNDLLVDGGTFNNFPADVMSQWKPGKIMGVDFTMSKSYELKFEDTPDSLELLRDKWRPKPKRKYRLPSLTSIILNTTLLYSYARRNETKLFLDIHFIPNVTKYSFMNWGAYEDLVNAGYEHALEVLESSDKN